MVAAQVGELRLGERFCGPPASANGGYARGAIVELLSGGVEVTLRRPPLPGGELWAAPWTPDPSVADQDGLVVPAVVWAALDCPGGFAAGAGDTVMVLGRMAAGVLARPRAGRAYCLVAWRGGPAAGRKQPAGSALLDARGGSGSSHGCSAATRASCAGSCDAPA